MQIQHHHHLTKSPKKDRDPTAVSNYCPLSLLNTEIKLFAKVLARRLGPLMTHLVHYDQTGFIKYHLASDNVHRLLHVIECSASILTPCAVLSVDAEKAFDRLEWHYLSQVLHHMGLGAQYISVIKVLYSSPIARVLIGSSYSDYIFISRGTRQRCPLSPSLFALSLDLSGTSLGCLWIRQKLHKSCDACDGANLCMNMWVGKKGKFYRAPEHWGSHSTTGHRRTQGGDPQGQPSSTPRRGPEQEPRREPLEPVCRPQKTSQQ